MDLTKFSPICLPNSDVWDVSDHYSGRHATVTGWGRLSKDANKKGQKWPYKLHELQDSLPIVTPDSCDISIDDGKFCTGRSGYSPKTVCSGDSGGPVTLKVLKNL